VQATLLLLLTSSARIAKNAAEGTERNLVILKKRVPGLSEAALERFLLRARKTARLRGSVILLVTGSRELQGLNQRFRGKNQATDVLSFPALPGSVTGIAGDVAISAEIAARNARRLGHTAAEEIKILALHGVLHLAGYDHERDNGEMARKEGRLRQCLGLPSGLIERNSRTVKKASGRQTRTRVLHGH
jgi:probable rRNA maturation factor